MKSKGIRSYLYVGKMLSTYEGASIQEIAESLSISERSVFNIINVLEDVGLAIYTEKDPENPRRYRYKSYNSLSDLFCA